MTCVTGSSRGNDAQFQRLEISIFRDFNSRRGLLLVYTAGEKSTVYRENLSSNEGCRVRSEKYGRSN